MTAKYGMHAYQVVSGAILAAASTKQLGQKAMDSVGCGRPLLMLHDKI